MFDVFPRGAVNIASPYVDNEIVFAPNTTNIDYTGYIVFKSNLSNLLACDH